MKVVKQTICVTFQHVIEACVTRPLVRDCRHRCPLRLSVRTVIQFPLDHWYFMLIIGDATHLTEKDIFDLFQRKYICYGTPPPPRLSGYSFSRVFSSKLVKERKCQERQMENSKYLAFGSAEVWWWQMPATKGHTIRKGKSLKYAICHMAHFNRNWRKVFQWNMTFCHVEI